MTDLCKGSKVDFLKILKNKILKLAEVIRHELPLVFVLFKCNIIFVNLYSTGVRKLKSFKSLVTNNQHVPNLRTPYVIFNLTLTNQNISSMDCARHRQSWISTLIISSIITIS